MAGGPILPSSAYPATGGSTFPNFYAGGGTGGSPHDEGLGVAASLAADATWELRFLIPPTVPSGIAKLRLLALANATSGAAKVTVNDAVVAAGASPSAASLTAETQATLTWTAADVYVESKVTLTPTPSGNGIWVVNLVFNATGWTLAAVSTWVASLIWE